MCSSLYYTINLSNMIGCSVARTAFQPRPKCRLVAKNREPFERTFENRKTFPAE